MADRGLVLTELRREVADTQGLGLLRQQVGHAQPRRIAQRLEPIGQGRRLLLGEAGSLNRAAARIILVPDRERACHGRRVHTSRITRRIEHCQ